MELKHAYKKARINNNTTYYSSMNRAVHLSEQNASFRCCDVMKQEYRCKMHNVSSDKLEDRVV